MERPRLLNTILCGSLLFSAGVHLQANAQDELRLPPLTKVALDEVTFRSAEQLTDIGWTPFMLRSHGSGQQTDINWRINIGSGVDMNATRLSRKALPSWMESEMWYSMKRSMDRMFSTDPGALNAPAAERNFEMHLDAEEQYRSQKY